jgi:hypothetical protein
MAGLLEWPWPRPSRPRRADRPLGPGPTTFGTGRSGPGRPPPGRTPRTVRQRNRSAWQGWYRRSGQGRSSRSGSGELLRAGVLRPLTADPGLTVPVDLGLPTAVDRLPAPAVGRLGDPRRTGRVPCAHVVPVGPVTGGGRHSGRKDTPLVDAIDSSRPGRLLDTKLGHPGGLERPESSGTPHRSEDAPGARSRRRHAGRCAPMPGQARTGQNGCDHHDGGLAFHHADSRRKCQRRQPPGPYGRGLTGTQGPGEVPG